jgi:hypothetical protein
MLLTLNQSPAIADAPTTMLEMFVIYGVLLAVWGLRRPADPAETTTE